jgi:hypothetical protein
MQKSDFIDWKNHPTTREVFKILEQYISGLQKELGEQAGKDSYLDAIKVGAIRAYTDVLEIEFGDGQE